MPTIFDVLELEAKLADIADHQEAVMLARNYFNGNQPVYINSRAQAYLGINKNNQFRFNICRTIVTALAEELNLLGFTTSEETEGDATPPVAAFLDQLYNDNKLDSLQDPLHEGTLSDSEGFIIVEWDPIDNKAKLIYNPYFVSTDSGGDGVGCYMIYENDDPEQRPIAAVKRWIESIRDNPLGPARIRQRMTIYYDDHLERYKLDQSAGDWTPFQEELGVNEDGEETFLDWNMSYNKGEAIGIPVFHFKNKGLRPEHWDAIPMQDSINKSLVDLLAAADLTGFQSFFGFGFFPTTDGKAPRDDLSNLMKMGPAQFNGTTKTPDIASLQVIPGQDPTPLMDIFKDLVLSTAQITETPASRFIVTAAIASDKTIKEQERSLRKKGADRRGLFGDPWVGAVKMAVLYAIIYGNEDLSRDVSISPIWEHTETLEELSQKKETLDIPIEQLWREAGYSEEAIESMKKDQSYKVKFESALWQGANQASLAGIPLELYLSRVGVPENEIKIVMEAIANQSGVTGENL